MTIIETSRLVLRLIPLEGLAATVAGDLATCRRIIGDVPADWFNGAWLCELRRKQCEEDTAYLPWSLRAMVVQPDGPVVGYMNCHDKPFDLDGRPTIELGYDVFEDRRRQGYAFEAIGGFTRWAATQGIEQVRLAIAPGNEASLALARKLGARMIGTQIDEVDGPEDVYVFALGQQA